VTYTPAVIGDVDEETGQPVLDEGTLVIRGDWAEGSLQVPVSGHAVSGCDDPFAVIQVEEGDEVIPGTTLHLRGDQSLAMVGGIVRWDWRVDQPTGAQGVFLPSPAFPNPTFVVDVAGTYGFRLDVWSEEGVQSCEPATYEVVVIPDTAIHVELLWTTPGDPDETDGAAADLDLHLVNPHAPVDPAAPDHDGDGAPDPYFDPTCDCWAGDPNPDWGTAGAEFDDDPHWYDGIDGEYVTLDVPENGVEYHVAVHYRDDHDLGAAYATIRIYILQMLAFQLEDVPLAEGDLWCVAFVDWPSGHVSPCYAEPQGGYRITADYPAPASE